MAPGEKDITIYHHNAIRVEKAGLANAFHDEPDPWDEKVVLQCSSNGVVHAPGVAA